MTEARELFNYQQQATEAKKGRRIAPHLKLAEEPAPVEEAAPKWTRGATRLDLLGWTHKVRMGLRIWSHEEITRGFWVSEEIAIHRNDERKGS